MPLRLALFPMQKELRFFVERLRADGHETRERAVAGHPVLDVPSLGIACSVGGHGKAQFAVQTQFLLGRLGGVSAVFCVGACGALCETVSLLDVVLGAATVEHDYRIRFQPDVPPPAFECDPSLLETLRAAPVSGFRVHAGTIASGDEDIVDATRARELRAQTSALAVAWEGAGCARACRFSAVPFLEVRAVTDSATASAPDAFARNLPSAMANAARLFESAFAERTP